jgi:hypothetical protein
MLTYAALTLGLIAILMAWRANRKNKDLIERIAQVNSRVYNLRQAIQENQELTQQELLRLKYEHLKAQGELQVTGQMKIGELVAAYPQAQQVLTGFHLGGCASCMVDDNQSLAEAAALNGRPLEPILVALNGLVTDSPNGQLSPEQLKTPNVQLQL